MHFLATWLVLFVGWVALVGALELTELAAGVVAATVALVATEAVRSQGLLHPLRLERAWIAGLARVPVAVVRDFGLLSWTLLRRRRPRGALREVRRPTGPGGLVALAASAAPNEIVVDVDDDRRVLVVHRLVQ